MSEKQDLINSVEDVAERAWSFYKDIIGERMDGGGQP